MKKSKRLLSLGILIIFTLVAIFTGCASETVKEETKAEEEPKAAEETKAQEEPKQESVDINIFQFKVEISKELEEAARAYEADNPNVKINIQTVGGGDDYGAALRAKFQSGSEPNIFNVGGPQDVMDWIHKLEDLSDQPWVDLAVEGVLPGVTIDGTIYGLPYNIEGYGLIYNKSIFADAGIDASKIVDFNSLEVAVKALDKKIKSGELKEKYPYLEAVFEYAVKETWSTGLHTSNAALCQEFDSSIDAFKADKVEFKYSDGLKAIIDLQADYSPNADSKAKLNAVDYSTQVDEGIAIERVAIIQQGNWVFGGVNDIDPDVAKNLGILPMAIKGAREDSIPVGVPMYWAVNKDSSDPAKKASKDFLNWLYTSDTGKDYIVNKFFFIPPIKGYEGLELNDSLGRAIMGYIEEEKIMPWVFMGYPTGWGMEVLGTEIQKYFAGKVTWEEAISNAQTRWTEMR